ncbi:hypothetical protein HAX54_034003 [Datura stramonium]|uniref:Uncharacterized protein n=1 Tax=Datura stramonium TaxID=4076 RepID=A0ABS8VGA8_DATST|nr:hypothetical protein [Datura stramonium]
MAVNLNASCLCEALDKVMAELDCKEVAYQQKLLQAWLFFLRLITCQLVASLPYEVTFIGCLGINESHHRHLFMDYARTTHNIDVFHTEASINIGWAESCALTWSRSMSEGGPPCARRLGL